MTWFTSRPLLLAVCFCLLALLASIQQLLWSISTEATLKRDRLTRLPKTMLWAWERPEDLTFIDPKEVGVAFLAKTIYLSGERVHQRQRLQPLHVPFGAQLLGVIRIEVNRGERLLLDANAEARIVSGILEVAAMRGLSGIQIDFDATRSERETYTRLVRSIRAGLADSLALSITALASWCFDDRWFDALPIDEAVPMLFRMGVDHDRIMQRLRERRDFNSPICKKSVGISTDEYSPFVPLDRTIYIFNPHPWTQRAYMDITNKLRS